MRQALQRFYGFPASPDGMLLLTDDQAIPELKPSRANLLRAFAWLVGGAQPGDALFFHYSGHGAQQLNATCAEEDGYDEALCPCDVESAGMIVDSEAFDALVAPLPPGVKLTAVIDCFHSGPALDLPFTWRVRLGWLEETSPCHSAGDAVVFSGRQDDQGSANTGCGHARPMGAMTTAFCNTVEKQRRGTSGQLTFSRFLESAREELKVGGFSQVPCMTASQRFDAAGKLFSPVEGMEGNLNEHLGRRCRKSKHPLRSNWPSGALGQLLAGYGGPAAVGAGGGLAGGLEEQAALRGRGGAAESADRHASPDDEESGGSFS